MDIDTRTKILRAAGVAFAELGYEATTVREICARAEVNLASVNYHFGDKRRLYSETIKYAHQFRIQQFPEPTWPEDVAPEKKLRDFVQNLVSRMLSAKGLPWQHRLMMRELMDPSDACRELAQDYFRPHFESLLKILNEMAPPSLPDYRRHQLAFSVYGQCLFYKFHLPVVGMLLSKNEIDDFFQPAQIADHVADVMAAALGRQPLGENSK